MPHVFRLLFLWAAVLVMALSSILALACAAPKPAESHLQPSRARALNNAALMAVRAAAASQALQAFQSKLARKFSLLFFFVFFAPSLLSFLSKLLPTSTLQIAPRAACFLTFVWLPLWLLVILQLVLVAEVASSLFWAYGN